MIDIDLLVFIKLKTKSKYFEARLSYAYKELWVKLSPNIPLSFANAIENNQYGGLTEILAAFVNDRIVNESPTKSSRMVLPVNQANVKDSISK